MLPLYCNEHFYVAFALLKIPLCGSSVVKGISLWPLHWKGISVWSLYCAMHSHQSLYCKGGNPNMALVL